MEKCYNTQVHNFVISLDELQREQGDPDPQLRASFGAVTTFIMLKTRLWAEELFDMVIRETCRLLGNQWYGALSDPDPRKLIKLMRRIDAKDQI